MPSLIPKTFRKRLLKSLTDKRHPAYGQIATIDSRGRPQVRTVHLRYIKERDEIAVAANIRSPKWAQLKKRPTLSGCYFDPYRVIQWRWESRVKLQYVGTHGMRVNQDSPLQEMWIQIRADVRAAYWEDYKKKANRRRGGFQTRPYINLGEPCPTFGVVLMTPTLWDVMEVNEKDYRKDRRTIHKLKNGRWVSRRVSVLHGRSL